MYRPSRRSCWSYRWSTPALSWWWGTRVMIASLWPTSSPRERCARRISGLNWRRGCRSTWSPRSSCCSACMCLIFCKLFSIFLCKTPPSIHLAHFISCSWMFSCIVRMNTLSSYAQLFNNINIVDGPTWFRWAQVFSHVQWRLYIPFLYILFFIIIIIYCLKLLNPKFSPSRIRLFSVQMCSMWLV